MNRFVIAFVIGMCMTINAIASPAATTAVDKLSHLKAIATIKNVEVVKRDIKGTSLLVHCRRVRAIHGTTVARTFTVTCLSTDAFWQRPDPKGPRLFHPKKKDRVYLTALRDGGPLTSYTPLTSKLLSTLLENPTAVRIEDGRAVIDTARPEKGKRR